MKFIKAKFVSWLSLHTFSQLQEDLNTSTEEDSGYGSALNGYSLLSHFMEEAKMPLYTTCITNFLRRQHVADTKSYVLQLMPMWTYFLHCDRYWEHLSSFQGTVAVPVSLPTFPAICVGATARCHLAHADTRFRGGAQPVSFGSALCKS